MYTIIAYINISVPFKLQALAWYLEDNIAIQKLHVYLQFTLTMSPLSFYTHELSIAEKNPDKYTHLKHSPIVITFTIPVTRYEIQSYYCYDGVSTPGILCTVSPAHRKPPSRLRRLAADLRTIFFFTELLGLVLALSVGALLHYNCILCYI